MDYEKKYNDALNLAKSYYGKGSNEFLDTIFPELAESEDERIRKELIAILKKSYNSGITLNNKKDLDRYLAYLERQKEQKPIECTPNSALQKIKIAITDCKKLSEHYKDTEENFYQYYGGKAEGLQLAFTYFENENEQPMEEQKPVDHKKAELTDFEQSVYDLCPVLGIDEAKATASDLLELAKKTLLKTGKVVLASNYPEGCSFEDGFHLGYNEGFNAKKEQKPAERPQDIHNRGYIKGVEDAYNNTNEAKVILKKLAKENPKQEWSEEDEKMRENLLYLMLENNSQDSWEGTYDWLKSLRPSWKPSEEQMEALHTAVYLEEMQFYGGLKDKLRDLYEQLKKL